MVVAAAPWEEQPWDIINFSRSSTAEARWHGRSLDTFSNVWFIPFVVFVFAQGEKCDGHLYCLIQFKNNVAVCLVLFAFI